MLKFEVFVIISLLVCSCINAGKEYDFNGLVYYFSYPMRKNWYQAMRHCGFYDMELLAIENCEEDEFVVNEIRNTNAYVGDSVNFWTSATNKGDNKTFYWASTGNHTAYTNWAPNQPSNGNDEDCVELHGMTNFKWSNVNCDRHNYFICEPIKCQTYSVENCTVM